MGPAWGALAGNLGLAALKLAGGWAFASQAVLADGVHSLGDAAGSAAVLLGMRVASAPPDAGHPYGHEKAETIAAFAVGVILVLAGLSVAADAVGRLLAGAPGRPDPPALAVAAAAIAVKGVLYRLTAGAARRLESAGLGAVTADHRSDLWSSVAAVAGVGGSLLGVRWADPLMALAVSGVLAAAGVGVLRDNLDELLEGRGASAVEVEVRRAALRVPGVRELHGVRTRTMGRHVLVDLKIGVDGSMSVSAGHEVARSVADAVHAAAPAVREVLVHVNPARQGLAVAEVDPTALRSAAEGTPKGVRVGPVTRGAAGAAAAAAGGRSPQAADDEGGEAGGRAGRTSRGDAGQR